MIVTSHNTYTPNVLIYNKRTSYRIF